MHGFGNWMVTSLFGYDKAGWDIPVSRLLSIGITSNLNSEGEYIL